MTQGVSNSSTAMKVPTMAGGLVRAWVPVFGLIVAAMIVQIFVKPLLGDFYAKVLLDIGINIVLAVSLTMVNGFTGQFSMGHAAFMAVGGYSAATIVYYGSFRIFGDAQMAGGLLSSMTVDPEASVWSKPWLTMADGLFLVSILAGGVVSAAAGYVVGLPSLRLKGDYLAIVSLGFGEIVRVLIQALTSDALYDADEIAQIPWYQFPKYIGGSLGFSSLPFYNSLFWSLGLAGLTMLFAIRLKRSTFGRAFLSVREDEIAAEAMGINTTKFKIRAFVIAAFFAGMAGALFAHTSGVQLNAGELGFQKSFDIIIMVVLGGLGSISGAAIAAVILTILPELLRKPEVLVGGFWGAIPLLVLGGFLYVISKRAKAQLGVPKFLLSIGAVLLLLAVAALLVKNFNTAFAEGRIDPNSYRAYFYFVAMGAFGIAAVFLLLSGILFASAKQTNVWFRAPKTHLTIGCIFVGVAVVALLMRNSVSHIDGPIDLGRYRMIFYALALIIMMIVRPQGLLSINEIWDRSLWHGLVVWAKAITRGGGKS